MIVSTPLLREPRPPGRQGHRRCRQHRQPRIVRDCPHVDRTIVWDHESLWHNHQGDKRRLGKQRYDLILSMSLRFSPAYQLFLGCLADATCTARASPVRHPYRQARMYDHTVDYPTDRHILLTISTLGAYKAGQHRLPLRLYNVDAYAGKALAFARRTGGPLCRAGVLQLSGQLRAPHACCRADAEALLRQLADRYPDHAIVVIHPPGDRARAAELVAASHARTSCCRWPPPMCWNWPRWCANASSWCRRTRR
jgi:ADP-heptose:LPS heptosyltransferase